MYQLYLLNPKLKPQRQPDSPITEQKLLTSFFARSPSSGGGKADRGVVCQARPQRDRVPGGRGKEEQPGAEAHGSDIPGGVAGISHLRAGATVAQRVQSSTFDAGRASSSTLNRGKSRGES